MGHTGLASPLLDTHPLHLMHVYNEGRYCSKKLLACIGVASPSVYIEIIFGAAVPVPLKNKSQASCPEKESLPIEIYSTLFRRIRLYSHASIFFLPRVIDQFPQTLMSLILRL